MRTNQKRRLRPAIRHGLTGFVIAVILCTIVGFGGCFAFSKAEQKTEITSTTLKASLEQASDLITTKYYYSEIGRFDNSYEINGWSIPFTGKSFILTYQGIAQLGFSTEDLDVSIKGKTIHVKCPAIQVLSNSIPSESVEVYDQSYNIFNPVTVDDYLQFETDQKQKALAKMEQNGTFEKAEGDARTAITQLLDMIPEIRENYTIEVEFAPREQAPASSQTSSSASSSISDTETPGSSVQEGGEEPSTYQDEQIPEPTDQEYLPQEIENVPEDTEPLQTDDAA